MGLGGATEMDKMSDDIRAELEQNRQYLVRALHAVETTSAECKEETRLATLKAENALSRLHLLEAAAADKDAELGRIQHAGEQHIRALQEELETQSGQIDQQRELTSGLQDALEAQTLTIRDLREQVYSLQLRVLKNDENADHDGALLNRVAEEKIAAVGARTDDCHRQLRAVCEEMQQQLEEVAGAMQQQEVKVHAQMSNSEALAALKLEEMESRIQHRLGDSAASAQHQANLAMLETALAELQNKWAASVQESKSEVEAMFKGEMMLSQRIHAIEGNIKGDIQAQIAQLEAAISLTKVSLEELSGWVQQRALSKDDLQAIVDETTRKDQEFRAKLDLVAEEMDKHSAALTQQKQRQTTDAENQVSQILPKIESLEQLIESVEALMSKEPSPSLRPGDSPRASALHAFHTMQNELKENSDKIRSLETRMIDRQAPVIQKVVEDAGHSGEVAALHQKIVGLGNSVQALDKKMEELTAANVARTDADKVTLEVATHPETNPAAAQHAVSQLKAELSELRQEHMNLFGRVVSMETMNKREAAGDKRSTGEDARTFDGWAVEERLSRIELAMIDILEKQTSPGDSEGSDWNGMLERLQKAEEASTNIMDGVQNLTETMSQVLEKQRVLDECARPDGAVAPAQTMEEFQPFEHPALQKSVAVESGHSGKDEQILRAELAALKNEQSVWKKEVERAVKLTTDAFGSDSLFVGKESLEQVRSECMEKLAEMQRDLNEGAGFTPRNVPSGEAARRSQVVSTGSVASPERLSQEHLQADALRFEFEKSLQDLGTRMQSVEGRVGAMEAGLTSGGAADASSPDKRESISIEIMQQYQVAIGHANDRIGEQQVAIEALQSAQDKWNVKLDQTLEVANEAFGEKTPFAMKGQVEHLESEHQHAMDELVAQRKSIDELLASTASAEKRVQAGAGPKAVVSTEEESVEGGTDGAHQALETRLTALEPMRDEFVAEKMHTDSEIQKLKQQVEDIVSKLESEMALVRSQERTVERKREEEVERTHEHEEAESKAKDGGIMHVESMIDSLQHDVQQELQAFKDSMSQQQELVQTQLQQMIERSSVNHNATAEPAAANTNNSEVASLHREIAALKQQLTTLKELHDELGKKLTDQDDVQQELQAFKDSMSQQQELVQTQLQQMIERSSVNHNATAEPAAANTNNSEVASLHREIAALKQQLTTLKELHDELGKKLTDQMDEKLKSVTEARVAAQSEPMVAREDRDASGKLIEIETTVASLQDEVSALKKKHDEVVGKLDDEIGMARKIEDSIEERCSSIEKKVSQEESTAREREEAEAKAKDGAIMHLEHLIDSLQDEVKACSKRIDDAQTQTQEVAQRGKERDEAARMKKEHDEVDAKKQAEAEANISTQLATLRAEVAAVRDEVKRQSVGQDDGKKERQAAADAAKLAESKLVEELSDLRSQVVALRDSTSIEGEMHKSLSDVENNVAECEAGLKNLNTMLEELGRKVEAVEKANKQIDLSALSRVSAQITELDEAMEVRENENAALDGRVEKLEQSEGMLANGISGLQARVDDISQQCKRVKEQARQLEEDMSRNTANKDELLKLKSVLDATKGEVSRVSQKIADLEERHRQQEIVGEGSVTARSLHSEREGSFSEFHDELAIASEGSARIRALAARVRGVTQSGAGVSKSVAASPIDAPARGGTDNSILSPNQIVTPRSMLEETAERIREWEIRNQGIAERSEGSESSGIASTGIREICS